VIEARLDLGAAGPSLVGVVQGSVRDPYLCGVTVTGEGEDPRLDNFCTCPLGFDCKHVAAALLAVLREATTAAAGASPRLGPWQPWLDALADAPPIRPLAAAAAAERRCAVILQEAPGTPPRLRAQATWVRPGKRGGFVAPQPMQRSYGASPWGALAGEEFRLIAALRMGTPSYGGAGEWYELRGGEGETLLLELLHHLPCFFHKPARGQLRAGPLRALRIGWAARVDGTQKLVLAVDGASAAASLFRIEGLWYHDPEAREIGRVDGEVRLAEAVLRAPALLPEQVPLLLQRWKDTPLLAALPQPRATREIERREVKPTAVLTLHALPALTPGGQAYEAGLVRLGFDYGGIRLPGRAGKPVERRLEGDRLIELVRDRATEIAAWERLEEVGLEPAELHATIRGLSTGALDDSDLVLRHGRGQVAGVEQVFALAPRLRDLGFSLESGDGFPFDLLDEPQEDAWFAEIGEEAGSPWFDLRLGIDLDGERIDLLPVLQRLLADPAFPLQPRKGEADDATWLVPIDPRRRMSLPVAKLRELLAPLLEWLEAPQALREGRLRLRRAQAEVVERLQQETPLTWQGGERLRATLDALRAPRAPAREPDGFGAHLRPYQREGLAWLGFLAEAGLGGILADDMGLGKTVQVLAHLLAEKQHGRLRQPALVIAPTSLVGTWRSEAARFAPALSVLVVHGPERAGLHAEVPRHDLVISTYPLLLRDREALLAHAYSVLVLDEAQAIKNARSQAARIVREFQAQQRIAMTGTPLENHLGELWATFDAVEPGLLGSEKHFTRFFRTPIEKHGNADRRERLKRRVAPLLLRRRKEDVLTELPPKTEITRSVELEGEQRALYETLRLAQHERVREEVRKRGLAQSGIVVLDALLKLRQACCDPRLVKLEGARRVKQSAKLDHLLELLDGLLDEGRRVLVFSQFAEMLKLIGTALDARRVRWQALTGDTPGTQRSDLIARFQAGAMPVFLISLKAGGVGLNLTAADTVIHYDPWWNPAVERQATDRAHRIGQDKPVFVYKLICAGTVEEKIQALQQRKAELAEAMLDGGASRAARFEEADLAELFAPL
jgi:superfamily II DNA or RNA helicase